MILTKLKVLLSAGKIKAVGTFFMLNLSRTQVFDTSLRFFSIANNAQDSVTNYNIGSMTCNFHPLNVSIEIASDY